MGAVKAIFRVFFNTYGSVRVDFAQPFSLKVRAKSKLLIHIFSLKKMYLTPKQKGNKFTNMQKFRVIFTKIPLIMLF